MKKNQDADLNLDEDKVDLINIENLKDNNKKNNDKNK